MHTNERLLPLVCHDMRVSADGIRTICRARPIAAGYAFAHTIMARYRTKQSHTPRMKRILRQTPGVILGNIVHNRIQLQLAPRVALAVSGAATPPRKRWELKRILDKRFIPQSVVTLQRVRDRAEAFIQAVMTRQAGIPAGNDSSNIASASDRAVSAALARLTPPRYAVHRAGVLPIVRVVRRPSPVQILGSTTHTSCIYQIVVVIN